MSRWFTAVVGLLIAAVAVWWVLRQVDLHQVAASMRQVADARLLLPATLLCLNLALKSWRWNRILSPVRRFSFHETWNLISIGFAGTTLLPARMGEVLRVWLLDRNYGLSLAQGAGTIVVERFMDVLLILFQFGIAMLFVPVSPMIRHGATTVLLGTVVLGLMLMGLAWRGPQAAESIERGPGRIRAFLGRLVRRLGEGMSALRQGDLVWRIVAMSMAIWSIEIIDNWVVLRLYGLPATLAWSGFLVGVSAMAQVVPGGPGYLGSMQAVTTEVLAVFNVPAVTAVSVSLTLFIINSTLVVLFGLVAYFQEIRKTPSLRHGPQPEAAVSQANS